MASKGKRTVWLTESPSESHKSRALMLGQHGFNVLFMRTAQEALDTMADNRPTCVLVDANRTNQAAVIKSVEKLVQNPELSGTRFILSTLSDSPAATKAATAENFRDIIPFDLPDGQWLQRFQHATSSKPLELSRPLCEVSMNQMAMAYVPARVVWISETHMRIECRGGQGVGSNFQISGDICKSLGVPHISLTVESVHRNELMYRFSQALVCKWRVPESSAEAVKLSVRRQMAAHPGLSSRYRAFVAIAKSDIRQIVAKELDKHYFEVKVALLRSTISQELSYFSPQIIFLDEKIIDSFEEIDFQMMASKIHSNVTIVVYGTKVKQEDLKRIFTHHKIFFEAGPTKKIIEEAHRYYNLPLSPAPLNPADQIMHILPSQAWSKIELQMQARLTSLNPAVGKVSLPFSVSLYTSIRLEAPILRKSLGRAPYIKITEIFETASTHHPAQFVHHGSFYLADVTPSEQALLSEVLLAMAGNYYQKQFVEGALLAEQMKVEKLPLAQAVGFNGVTEAPTQPKDQFGTTIQSDTINPVRTNKIPGDSPGVPPIVINKSAQFKPTFNIRDYVDPVIIRALLVFLVAMSIVFALLNMAMRIDPSYYQDHGKQYSDFFRRMSDPSFRQKNRVPQDLNSPSNNGN